MQVISLFSGIGGFDIAARWMGWETVAWCEWDKNCQRVLKYHFPNAIPHDDITKTDFTRYAGQIDILTGGFPCQPYSTAGKRLGKDDDRHLWPEMLRAIREVRPRWVVGENVRGLVSWNGGLVFDEVQTDLEAEGYEVLPFILPACAVDAPHRRDRVWFVAKNTKSSRCVQRKLEKGFAGIWGQWDACAGSTERVHLQARSTSNSDSIGWIQSNSKPKSGQLAQNIPDWRGFPTQSPVCGRNDRVSTGLAGITVPKHRRESLKAYGNAIVPQVAYQIFKAIQETENQLNTYCFSAKMAVLDEKNNIRYN